jgi:peroxiredoxin Q/BCP
MYKEVVMSDLIVGSIAPDFSLPSASSQVVRLSDFKGKKVVLYFYPKDHTSGCTQQACDFRDAISSFRDKNAVILGVSKDSLKSHQSFLDKYDLPFELLTDEDSAVQILYDVWKEKSMYGKTYMGTERSTFVIDENGILTQIHRKVKVKGHIEALLETL